MASARKTTAIIVVMVTLPDKDVIMTTSRPF
jgi:hypothetical protein